MRYLSLSILVFGIAMGAFFALKSPSEKRNTLSKTINSGDSLYTLLKEDGISSALILEIERALKPIFDPRRCKPGDRYELTRTADGQFVSLRYCVSPVEFYIVERDESGKLSASFCKIPLEREIAGIRGEIESSLYETMIEEGVSPDLILQFADIFSWQIDFFTETRKGDSFRFIWEVYRKDEFIQNGRILAAEYVNDGKVYTAIYFGGEYYDAEGNSLKKVFLRSPLNYRRISSYFSHSRLHPISKRYRPHFGIDYAAPAGTPVVSIGDGIVVERKWKRGYGRFIKVRHNSRLYTTYGHLSRYARGIKRGVRVRQGQVIGYVGSTGVSTGPHLDFRVIKDGRFINFLRMKIPSAAPVPKGERTEFYKIRDKRMAQLDIIEE